MQLKPLYSDGVIKILIVENNLIVEKKRNLVLNPILVTGGAGFIGSALVRYLIDACAASVVVVDKLTYAGNLASLAPVASSARYAFEQADICDPAALHRIFSQYRPAAVMHLAAESHVDRSIDDPEAFIDTNIVGTYRLLEVTRHYWQQLSAEARQGFRFHHISTDEVYGDLHHTSDLFTETTPYAPSSPYSASKAASDHLVRAWQRTYGLPAIVTNCSNNYGPYHFPEKLIPLTILNALAGESLPVYGDGTQIRDWLFVEDHVKALWLVLNRGKVGETYNIGGHNEVKNIALVTTLCHLLDELAPKKPSGIDHYSDLIVHVSDRPGHDGRYAIDAEKIERELGWRPIETLESGLRKTVSWYMNNQSWWQGIRNRAKGIVRQGYQERSK